MVLIGITIVGSAVVASTIVVEWLSVERRWVECNGTRFLFACSYLAGSFNDFNS
jgi:hypothetical protein